MNGYFWTHLSLDSSEPYLALILLNLVPYKKWLILERERTRGCSLQVLRRLIKVSAETGIDGVDEQVEVAAVLIDTSAGNNDEERKLRGRFPKMVRLVSITFSWNFAFRFRIPYNLQIHSHDHFVQCMITLSSAWYNRIRLSLKVGRLEFD